VLALGPPHSAGPELVRRRQLEHARRAGWPQLEHDDIVFRRFGLVEHKPTGRLYRLHRGQLVDALYTTAVAWYLSERDEVVFLEDAPGPARTVAELEARRSR
jgi:hypothetical protein